MPLIDLRNSHSCTMLWRCKEFPPCGHTTQHVCHDCHTWIDVHILHTLSVHALHKIERGLQGLHPLYDAPVQ